MKRIIALGLMVSAMLVSCKEDTLLSTDAPKTSTTATVPKQDMQLLAQQLGQVKGRINIYLSEHSIQEIKISDQGLMAMSSAPSPMATALSRIKATRVERLFPPAGKYEKRTREAGLHRWMRVTFDESTSSEAACQIMSALSDVDYAEPVFKISNPETRPVPFTPSQRMSLASTEEEPIFNDPMLADQWHYKNTGAAYYAQIGADINVHPAWKLETGSPKVIVAIVDGGIDIDHEDLKDNLMINKLELNGTPEVDDDNNGFVDDIYGYNFVTNSPTIEPDDFSHGTHVAGTVGARNNNGVGVCGVAGGDGKEGTGVRLLSCQIFRKGVEQGDAESAIKYGADNGAVISQNSWGYKYPAQGQIPRALKDAIDYFIKYAGCDPEGNQRADSPMKGGVVIFAAGNDSKDFLAIPASYSKVISVAAMSPNFTKASYSNRGDWVTIMAPGGDQERYGNAAGVLSTLSPKVAYAKGQLYGYMEGTSMACPHVSGVAALIVSRFGGMGYTKDQLIKQLKASLLDVNIDEENPGFEGRLGLGYIDSHKALTLGNQNKSPQSPKVDMERSSKAGITEINLFWTVPSDEDDGTPSTFRLFMSKEPLTKENYETQGIPQGPGESKSISAFGRKAGDEMKFSLHRLTPETTYHFALVAVDRWGLKSEPVLFEIKTRPNTPPKVTGMPADPIRLNASINQKVKLDLVVRDPDGHQWRMEKPQYMKGVSVNYKPSEEQVSVSILPSLAEGKHRFTLVFVDELGAKTELVIEFEIYKIKPPRLLAAIGNKLLGVAQAETSIDLGTVFEGDPETTLSFSAKSSDPAVAAVEIQRNRLVVKGNKAGEAMISVSVRDGIDNVLETRFEVVVVADSSAPVYSVFPIPARTEVNAWLNKEIKTATFVLTTVRGEEVLRQVVRPDEEGLGTVNIKKFVPGVYHLSIISSMGTYTKTIVKQ